MSNTLRDRAASWADHDVDEHDRQRLRALIAANDIPTLTALVDGDVTFGTAGLRAAMAPGPNRMNRATVIRTTYAVAGWLTERTAHPTVVVGRDARHNSDVFMADVVAVLVAAGVDVVRFDRPVPTPLVAFAQAWLAADAAIVVTASHNPAADNGYKLYGSFAAQIVAPDDMLIQARIQAAPYADEIPRHDGTSPLVTNAGDEVVDAYLAMVRECHIDHGSTRPHVVYTPLHGVGAELFLAATATCGYDQITVVSSQAEPDPTFPTVAFPNPEERGALDAAVALATLVGADVVVANDPDADRLAIAVPDGTGGFRVLHGNEIGVLLTDYLLEHTDRPRPLIVTTVVSTPMVTATATRHGATVERTFTGFKWIARAAQARRDAGDTFVYGFEEALGSNVTPVINDKDGVSAAVVFLDFLTWLAARGETVTDRLAMLGVVDGVWVSRQVSVVKDGADGQASIAEAMQRLRQHPPERVGNRRVVTVNDYTVGGQTRPVWRGEDLLVELVFDDGRVLVRPSGTEPKLKTYVDLSFPVDAFDQVADVIRQGERDAVRTAEQLLDLLGIR